MIYLLGITRGKYPDLDAVTNHFCPLCPEYSLKSLNLSSNFLVSKTKPKVHSSFWIEFTKLMNWETTCQDSNILWSNIFIFRFSTSATPCTTMMGSWTAWTSTALFVARAPCSTSPPWPATTPRTPSPAPRAPASMGLWSLERSRRITKCYR